MSLILEALKKSERQRRLGESPSLGSPVMAVRRRRSMLPALVALIAIGLGGLWWMQRGDSPSGGADVAAPTVATPPSAAVTPPPAPADARQPTPAAQPMQTRQASESQREKLRSGELVAADAQAGAAATIKESEPVSAADPAALAAAMANANAQNPAAGQTRVTPAAPAAKTPEVTTKSPSVPATQTVPTTPAAAASGQESADSLKLMWELPLALRSKLPELKLSMHVFAAEPAQRFVIINGERGAEGDEVEGMKLIEIRKDGVVFEYEGERFLYPRGGR